MIQMPLQNIVLVTVSEAYDGTIQKIYHTDDNELMFIYLRLEDGGYIIRLQCYSLESNQLLWKVSYLTAGAYTDTRLEFGTFELAEAWGDYLIDMIAEKPEILYSIEACAHPFDEYGGIRMFNGLRGIVVIQ